MGIAPRSVDDARYTAAARRLVRLNSFWHARKHLERNPNRAEGILSSLTLSGADLDLTCGESLPSETTDTFKNLHDLKWRLARDGVFRFADMFAFAQRALRDVPGIAEAVSSRFPVVFFDEMQDTGALQEALAKAAFGNRSTIQRFGDCNQGIFDGSDHTGTPNSFPVEDAVDLSHSRRFGPFIAAAASPLAVIRSQTIIGNPERAEKRHAIFLFDQSCVDRVLPAFGETHDATLVLTSSKSKLYDLKEALGPLSGTSVARTAKSIQPQLMNLFVGITRPKSLLCLAVVADHITEAQQTALVGNGWLVQDLRVLT